jgi:hypothetical protein
VEEEEEKSVEEEEEEEWLPSLLQPQMKVP